MEHPVVGLEDGFWRAAGDGAFYQAHMAVDGVCVLPVGVLDRDETIGAIAQAESWRRWEMRDVRLVELTGDVVTLVYRVEADRGEEPYRAFVASTYVRRDGDWLLVVHQQTPLG